MQIGTIFVQCAGKARRLAMGVALALGFSSPCLAGAWLMEEGKGQLLVTGTLTDSTAAFDSSRNARSAPRYEKFELQGLLEYGITDWFTAIVSPQFQHVGIAAPVDAQRNGVGYSEFGGRARLAKGDSWIVSFQSTLRLPGTRDDTNPAAIGYTDNEADLRVLFGTSFSVGAWPAFIDLQAAERIRAGGPPNEFRADTTFGLRPHPQWLVLAQTFSVISQGSGSALFPSYDYHKLQMSLVHQLTPALSLQAGTFTTVSGRHALRENGIVLGAGYKF